MQNRPFFYIMKCFVNECYLLFVPEGQTFFTQKRGGQTSLDLKGLSTLNLTCSVSKDHGLLILTLTLIFDLVKNPEQVQFNVDSPFKKGGTNIFRPKGWNKHF